MSLLPWLLLLALIKTGFDLLLSRGQPAAILSRFSSRLTRIIILTLLVAALLAQCRV